NMTIARPGTTLGDTALLFNAYHPTGSITFNLYAPGVNPSVGQPAFTQTVAVNKNGTYHTTGGFAANTLGTWHWVAVYSGDSLNNPVSAAPLSEPVQIVHETNLYLTKSVSQSQVFVGQTVQFPLPVFNMGPDTATGVAVFDPLPPGLVLVSY